MYRFLLLVLAPALLYAQAGEPAQELRTPVLAGARIHHGFIIPHSKEIIEVSNSKPFGFELNLEWLLASEKYTSQSGILAKRGFVLQYINYDYPEVLGQAFSAAACVEPLIRADRRLYGSVQLGLGFSYLTRVYDKETNPKNLFFSTPVSFFLMTNAYLWYKINPHWEASLGFNYNHISNGGIKEPNKGMNFPTFNAGWTYNFNPVSIKRPAKNTAWKTDARYYAYILAIGSLKTAQPTDAFPEKKTCRLFGGLAMVGWRAGRLSGLSVGTEWIQDGWTREMLDRADDRTSALKGSVLIGYELLIGRTRFTIHQAPYLYNPSRKTDPIYQRYGLYYQFGKHLLLGATLKAHRHVADVFDVRLGWTGSLFTN